MDRYDNLDLIISLLPLLKIRDKINLLNVFDKEENFVKMKKSDIEDILKCSLNYFWNIDEIRNIAQRADSICRMRGGKWVSWRENKYPPLLREIYDPPPVIFYRGELPNPERSLLGMVGTRKPSSQAASQAYNIAYGVGKAGISVVSGLAIGIDAISHRGNLISSAPGYAVLGSGIDEIYPSTNRPLAKRILDSGGALISEYPPGTGPFRWNFPARNRIISALSRSVLIVEAPKRSGSLITGGFALDQGKDLWVASAGLCEDHNGMLYDRTGTIKLGNDGAEVIHCANDILEKWGIGDLYKNDTMIHTENSGTCSGVSSQRELVTSMASYLEIEL